jgi:hypothetical protein
VPDTDAFWSLVGGYRGYYSTLWTRFFELWAERNHLVHGVVKGVITNYVYIGDVPVEVGLALARCLPGINDK